MVRPSALPALSTHLCSVVIASVAAQQMHTLTRPYPLPVEGSLPLLRHESTVLNGRPMSGATCWGRSIRWRCSFGFVVQLQDSVTACPRLLVS